MKIIHKLVVTCSLIGVLTLLLASCKPTIPSEYLQPDEMEDVLYDYHLAMSLANIHGNGSIDQRAYKLVVLKKYGVSEHKFDSSLEYYMRHTQKLQTMYEDLTKRFENEARLQGASESDFAQFGSIAVKGDTTDIWKGSRTLILSPYALVNQRSFDIPVDTAFHKGDRFVMNFDSQYIVQEGVRDAMAVLSVTFSNDSIVTQVQHVFSGGRQTITIENPDTLGVKSVKGFFLMLQGPQPTSTFKMLVLQNIQLVRMHVHKSTADEQKKDSIRHQDPIRTIGGAPVNNSPNAQKIQPAMQEVPEIRTPQQAMQERGIPTSR